MQHRTTLTCHCEEQSDVGISGRYLQLVQGGDKTCKPIASVAALSERLADYKFSGTIVDRTHIVGDGVLDVP